MNWFTKKKSCSRCGGVGHDWKDNIHKKPQEHPVSIIDRINEQLAVSGVTHKEKNNES